MAYVDSTTATGASDFPSVAVPTGAQANDIAILVATVDNTTTTFETGDWPTGFVELAEVGLTMDGQRVGVAWKRLTGADAGSYTLGDTNNAGAGTPDWVCQAILFRGRSTGNPPVISTTASSNASNTTPVTITANAVTAEQGDDILWISAPDVSASGVGAGHTPPSGYTEAEDQELGFSNLSLAYKENVAAGTTGTVAGTFTLTGGSSGWAAWLIRIPSIKSFPSRNPDPLASHIARYRAEQKSRDRFTRKGSIYVPSWFAKSA